MQDEGSGRPISRRQVLAGAVGGIAVAAVGGPAALASASPKLPPGWLENAPVNITEKQVARGSPNWRVAGTVAGVALDVSVTFATPSAGNRYTYKGKYGTQAISYTVQFDATHPGSFTAKGSFGSNVLDFAVKPQPSGSPKWPVTGTIGGQPLHAAWSQPANRPPGFSGTLGKATASGVLGALPKHKVGFKVTGHSSESGTTGTNDVAFTALNGGPDVAVTGQVSGPAAAVLVGLSWFPILSDGGG